MSSNKNLKVYKMVFVTHLKKLTMNVKFACKLKATWKRSNQSAESTLVPLQSGVADFDQQLKLNINMYYDQVKNKFVQKKCMYSFVLATEKGQKSAGNVVVDVAQFFNKKLYQMDQAFTLEKCPVPGAKVQMKITYEQDSTQQSGYDSLSCISSTNPNDYSVASVDLSDLAPTKSNISSTSKEEVQKSQKSDLSTSKTQKQKEGQVKVQQSFSKLDASDVMQYSMPGQSKVLEGQSRKIGQNIKSINSLTAKINDFVTDKSKNIKYQIESFKRKINSLQEQLQGESMSRQRLQRQLQQQKQKTSDLQKQLGSYKLQTQHTLETQRKKTQQLQSKLNNTQQLLQQMESQMNQSGQSQSVYIEQLKSNHRTTEEKFTQQLQNLRENLMQQKRSKNQLTTKITELEAHLKDMRQKYTMAVDKNTMMEDDMHRKEEQLQNTRLHLQRTYQHLVSSLNHLT